ncbi:unnamed protein product [Soboliphyme baturini]|uniref:Phospholipase A2 n=1 Tax=Soboliphyme baturini TaxID=241478 RepID=A0A183J2M4_9BILA|nr:unnamed protein product [Soboliphyme baturini]
MFQGALVGLLLACCVAIAYPSPARLLQSSNNYLCGKRNSLWNFGCMVYCTTKLDAFTHFNNYGCYCGFGGSGKPVDGMDECCMHHDQCYDAARANGYCGKLALYTTSYKWTCFNRTTPICNVHQINKCSEELCKCDRQASLCFARYTYPKRKPGCNK